MDIEEFLTPVPFDKRAQSQNEFLIGNTLRYQLDEDLQKEAIVLVSLAENGHTMRETEDPFFFGIREHFADMVKSNWQLPIYDLGTVMPGETFEDTCFAVYSISKQCSEKKLNLVWLGGTQALSHVLFKAIKKKFINVGTIDMRLDIDARQQELSADNFVAKMILNEEQKLLDYVNIGSQAPYNASEEFDVLEHLNFENIRLGKATTNLSLIEPYVRELDLVSVDMSAMQSISFSSAYRNTPNGFNQREICGVMRYLGLSNSVRQLHISNFISGIQQEDALLAEMLWYYIDAKNNQKNDNPKETYRVQFGKEEIVFLRGINSERWWIEVMVDGVLKRVPCSEQDYQSTLQGELPNRWLKFYKKFY